MNRRTFIRNTAATSLALSQTGHLLAALEPDNAYRKNIGIQLYTLRDALGKDPAGTLKQVAAAGYKQVELYGFPDADALVSGAKDAGLAINSAHFQWDCVVDPKDAELSDFARVVEKAHSLGLTELVIPYLTDGQRGGLDSYKKIAANANKAAGMAKKAGIRLSYHNHNFEFQPKEGGTTGYDIFIKEFSRDVFFEIDVFWVKAAGLDPVELITKLKGRVSQLHLKDLKSGIAIPSYATDVPHDAFQELGDGIIAMEPILSAAKAAGVKHCHVEQDQSPDALASIRQSMDYLRKL
ncbi:sugar phosphate isomerase/epimerase [Luteolibacter yonseiensis]|uniref:Sugar phosphate isomerase/epimerase n=1 Tax=Luteolibacter yonseiensis TaxID=1144680 RepID=A0A934R449_9BACT|nr:sugar phosphate isomerase/epimerase [Luteolibacter yonseiensis]MBK1814834.1 sugar phosphate isomerase/epimerase [Luteolibacter yonseiensis]